LDLAKSVLKEQGANCIITVDVIPNAPRTELGKVNEWRGAIQIKVAAPPKEGEANDELVRFLAERLGIPRDKVKILRGGTSRHKTISVSGPREKLEELLGVHRC
jgi:uncharacterized protein (TIGR00251 family)